MAKMNKKFFFLPPCFFFEKFPKGTTVAVREEGSIHNNLDRKRRDRCGFVEMMK
jgi:hypothetical protein